MRRRLKLTLSAGALLVATGCASPRTVVVNPKSTLMLVGPDVRGHVYYQVDGVWQLSPDVVRLPEGWTIGWLDWANLPAK